MNEDQALIAQIVELLKQGKTPEELLEMGVPEDLLQQAMAMIQQEAQAGAGPQPMGMEQAQQQPAGLADMYAQGGM